MPRVTETYTELEHTLDYNFSNKKLLKTALTHRSLGRVNNERLEYLGDALLGFIIAEAVYQRYPEASEGELTRLRALLVKGETLAGLARDIGLGNYLKLGSGELKSGGWRRKSILANTLEAIIGAIYMDSGLETTCEKVLGLYKDLLENTSPDKLTKDPKTRLQEHLQANKHALPNYKIISEKGAAHEKKFSVMCEIADLDMNVLADGRSKRVAEQAAARKALELLKI